MIFLNLPEGYLDSKLVKKGSCSGDKSNAFPLLELYLLLDAEILLLDDALSAVDGKTEYQILQKSGSMA